VPEVVRASPIGIASKIVLRPTAAAVIVSPPVV
jgi:hypothetical protein